MSALGIDSSTVALPTVNPALEPESVRNGTPAVKHAYQEGLGFEEMLTEELTKSLAESGGMGGEGEAEGGISGEEEGEGGLGAGGSSLVSSMLPRTLAESIVSGGGMGLAAQLAGETTAAAAKAGNSTTATSAAGGAAGSGAAGSGATDSGAAGGGSAA